MEEITNSERNISTIGWMDIKHSIKNFQKGCVGVNILKWVLKVFNLFLIKCWKEEKNHDLLKVKGPKLFWIVVGMEGYQNQCESNSPTYKDNDQAKIKKLGMMQLRTNSLRM
jgi:hypothetical protein